MNRCGVVLAFLTSLVVSAGAFAQQVAVYAQVGTVIQLVTGDFHQYAIRVTPVTPGDPADPAAATNCGYGVVYFGVNGNPTARDRTLYNSLFTMAILAKPLSLYYVKTSTVIENANKRLCVVDRIDMSF